MEKELAERVTEEKTGRGWDVWVWVAIGLVLLGAVLNTIYLFRHCPIDLSEDEAHYWEWSRHLDYGYYSKPPGIAWVIWAALRIGGMLGLNGDGSGVALAPVMRMAAVVFGMCSGMLSLLLARRMFWDDGRNGGRAALAVILLCAAVPMFAVGSLLITIDSPMYLCWAGTVVCLWRCVETTKDKGRKTKVLGGAFWLYAAGIWAGAGMLFKPVGIILPMCCLIGAWADRGGMGRAFKTWHALGAFVVMMASQAPVVLWNAHHGWVMFLHIGTQGGLAGGVARHRGLLQAVLLDPISRVASYVGGQAGGMGGVIFVLLVIAVVAAWRKARTAIGFERTRWVFLLSFAAPLWGFYFLLSFWKGTEPNWPAASYFAGMILLAGVMVAGWQSAEEKVRKAWQVWGTIAVVSGIFFTAMVMNFDRFYPVARSHLEPLAGTPAYFASRWHPRFWAKPLYDKLLGMAARAEVIEPVRVALARETGQEPLVITGRYDTSSSLAFYLPGQPFVYCLMSNLGGRMSQYDLWPGLNEEQGGKAVLAGRPAVIVGIDGKDFAEVVRPAFERVEGPEKLPIVVDGITLKMVTVYKAWGYKGRIGRVRGAGGSY